MAAAAFACRMRLRGTSRKIQVPGSSTGSLGFGMAGRVALSGNPFNYLLTYKAMFTYTRFLWKGGEKNGDGQAIGQSPRPTES